MSTWCFMTRSTEKQGRVLSISADVEAQDGGGELMRKYSIWAREELSPLFTVEDSSLREGK